MQFGPQKYIYIFQNTTETMNTPMIFASELLFLMHVQLSHYSRP